MDVIAHADSMSCLVLFGHHASTVITTPTTEIILKVLGESTATGEE